MKLDATYAGRVMRGTDLPIYAMRADGNFADAYALTGATQRVVLTGYTVVSTRGNTMHQTTNGGWICIQDGWTEIGITAVYKYSDSAAQRLVNKIINNDIQITQNNLVCARYASKFTEEQQQNIRELQRHVENRKNALQAGGLCENIATSYPKGYVDLENYLNALMSGEAIGIATWVVVVIAATIVVGMGTAAYFAYKSLADESERDIKYSKQLMAVLAEKLTPEEYQQLLDETKGIVTKAKIKQSIGNYGRVLWLVGVLIAGAMAYKFINGKING